MRRRRVLTAMIRCLRVISIAGTWVTVVAPSEFGEYGINFTSILVFRRWLCGRDFGRGSFCRQRPADGRYLLPLKAAPLFQIDTQHECQNYRKENNSRNKRDVSTP